MYEHFYRDGHNGFLEDVAITLIDKTDGRDPKNRESYGMRTLKMLASDGLNNEDCVWPNTVYTTYHTSYLVILVKGFYLFGWQYIRTWMVLGLHGIRTTIFGKRLYVYVYIYVCVCLGYMYIISIWKPFNDVLYKAKIVLKTHIL